VTFLVHLKPKLTRDYVQGFEKLFNHWRTINHTTLLSPLSFIPDHQGVTLIFPWQEHGNIMEYVLSNDVDRLGLVSICYLAFGDAL
jgi:hypothetical protein